MVVNELVGAELAARQPDAARQTLRRGLLIQLVRMRFQVLGGLLFSVVLPLCVAEAFGMRDALALDSPTLLGSIGAFSFGYLVFRKVTAYPGVRAATYVIPAFLTAYLVVIAVVFAVRLEVSHTHFLISFLLAITFFYTVLFFSRRVGMTELALVPIGDFKSLLELKFIRWRTISSPEGAAGRAPIVVDLRADLTPEWERFVTESALAGRQVYNARQVKESLSGKVQIDPISDNRFDSLIPNLLYSSAKRFLDFLAALMVLAFVFPFLFLIGLLVRVDSPGPALFRQQRMGFGGRAFVVYKFRTMHQLDHEQTAAEQMIANDDARVTRLGRILRKIRLDELPQILNIVRGEMSRIGPRPEALKLSHWYETRIPFYRYRHVVLPGITGWAQVNQG